jgi:hypothetical protein
LFLSYARADDEPFVQRLYTDLTASGFDAWFDRVSMPSRGDAFTVEIERAISERERFLFIVGPEALKSEYVSREWGFADRVGKAISPIVRIGKPEDLPSELRLLDARDFTDDKRYGAEFERLLQQISQPPLRLGKLVAVPALPQHFLLREDRLKALKDALAVDILQPHRDIQGRVVGVTSQARSAGVHGMGGIGKSVLADTLCRDTQVRRSFPDGIAWVGVGEHPDVVALQRDLVRALGGDGVFDSVPLGKTRLHEILEDKAVLLVLDDVWHRHHAEAFDALGPRCRLLLTTRDASLVTAMQGTHHQVELLTEPEARALLGESSGTPVSLLPPEAAIVIRECGHLPLALAICGAMIRDKAARWSDLVEAFNEHDLKYFKHRQGIAGYEHPGIFKAIEIGINALEEQERQRFAELSIFPPDRPTPAAAVYTLWGHTGQLRERNAARCSPALSVHRSCRRPQRTRRMPPNPILRFFCTICSTTTPAIWRRIAKRCMNPFSPPIAGNAAMVSGRPAPTTDTSCRTSSVI